MNNTKQKQMYAFLIVLTVSCTMGLFTWRTLFNNFAVETAGLSGEHVGMIQSVREIPGFLAFLLVFILLIIKEHRLAALSIILLGIGVAVTGLFPTYWGLLITTFAMSFGFHYYQTISQSLTLQYFDKTTSPWILGRLRSFAS
ncbi:MAG: MFS transporter, partial [Deltaproteobacteria bacterium]|nr:MFS transporter [Deltaproteobacteria bacterium]